MSTKMFRISDEELQHIAGVLSQIDDAAQDLEREHAVDRTLIHEFEASTSAIYALLSEVRKRPEQ
jgi:hypothetical protein